jgi:hypothetical protein
MDSSEKQDKIRKSKREYARKMRLTAKTEGKLSPSDKNKETNRVIAQTIRGGNTHLDKLKLLEITLGKLYEYCEINHCDLLKIQPHILKYLESQEKNENSTQTLDNTFDSIFTIDSFNKATKSPITAKTYLSKFNSIKKILDIYSNSKLIDYLINCPETACQKLHEKYHHTTITYISAIIFLLSHFEQIKTLTSDTLLNYYKEEVASLKTIYMPVQMEKTDGILSWDQITSLRTKIKPEHRYGLYHLMLCLYSCIPPMRDDFGLVHIIETPDQTNDKDNFYVLSTNTFYFNHYKTADHYHSFNFIVPSILQDVIKGSLEINPRPYLITKNNNLSQEPYNNGTLSGITKKLFEIDQNLNGTISLSFNDFRHAFETYMGQYGIDFTLEEKKMINKILGHDSNQRDYYIRDQIRSEPLFKTEIDKTNNTVQRISDKIGGFYDIGMKVVPHRPTPPPKKIKITVKKTTN